AMNNFGLSMQRITFHDLHPVHRYRGTGQEGRANPILGEITTTAIKKAMAEPHRIQIPFLLKKIRKKMNIIKEEEESPSLPSNKEDRVLLQQRQGPFFCSF